MARTDRAATAVAFGWAAVVGGPFVEFLGLVSWRSSCESRGLAEALVVVATVGLLAGGVAAILVGRRQSVQAARLRQARTLGVVALVLGVASIPLNVATVGFAGLCVLVAAK